MPNPSRLVNADIKYEHIAAVIRKVELLNYTFFECGGIDHCLVYESPNERDVTPAWYSYPSRQVNGADIIIADTVPINFRRPMLLHEVSEVLLRRPDCDRGVFKIGIKNAHQTAREWDERFARETLDDKAFDEYIKYKKQFSLCPKIGSGKQGFG